MHLKTYSKVLAIAGSDSGGGAGIQADIKTISANGCYAETAITALTAQNTKGVWGIFPIPVDFVAQQINVVLSDLGADAIKIGMLHNSSLIETVTVELCRFNVSNIVVDPVMVAQSGDFLLEQAAIDTLKKQLFPLADLITPNIPEAEMLLGTSIKTEKEMEIAAFELAKMGAKNVLIKGGHLNGTESNDLLYVTKGKEFHWYAAQRYKTPNNHGTGCTLSSAIASHLALGKTMPNAVATAKKYITNAIDKGSFYKIGNGNGPVHHFFSLWDKSE